MKASQKHPLFIIEDMQKLKASRAALHKWVNDNGDFVRGILKFNLLTRAIDRDANCVLCEVLDGGAIYGSSLGQNTLAYGYDVRGVDNLPLEAAPLRYFIVYNDLSKYQLGRLVRLTNVLGELRMAAVFDIAQLSQASVRIQALGNYITERTSPAALTEEAKATSLTTVLKSELKTIQEELYKISSSGIPGGLAFRVTRSRYYAKAFKSRLKGMRVRRIEGWEPYDSFVRRKIYQVFRFLGDVGIRFESLSNRIHRLVTAHNAERLNGFQDNVRTLVQEMNHVNNEIRDVQKDTLRVQILGEAIGVVAFAYYGGHIIASFITSAIKTACTTGLCSDNFELDSDITEIISVIIALLLLLKTSFWERWRKKRETEIEEARKTEREKREREIEEARKATQHKSNSATV